eukprot:1151258-Alexandrium_andersonii.AAC.1
MRSPGLFPRDRAFIAATPTDSRQRRLPERREVFEKGRCCEQVGRASLCLPLPPSVASRLAVASRSRSVR